MIKGQLLYFEKTHLFLSLKLPQGLRRNFWKKTEFITEHSWVIELVMHESLIQR